MHIVHSNTPSRIPWSLTFHLKPLIRLVASAKGHLTEVVLSAFRGSIRCKQYWSHLHHHPLHQRVLTAPVAPAAVAAD